MTDCIGGNDINNTGSYKYEQAMTRENLKLDERVETILDIAKAWREYGQK